ncbi:hydrolase [Spirochaetia bacterium]|nr:hydrolase [Spirochaetia bacterium]
MFSVNSIGRGYLRSDGKKGIRNKVLVVYTVDCSFHVAQKIADYFFEQGEDVEVVGNRSCFDNQLNIRRLLSFLVHPNVGAALIIGNGCEYTQPARLCAFAREEGGRDAEWFNVQEAGGTTKAIEHGKKTISLLLEKLKKIEMVPLYISDLFFGAECGGSDFASGLAGNHLVGDFFDQVIDSGGTCVFEEIAEAVGLGDWLVERGANEKAKQEIRDTYDKMVYRCKLSGQYSISPGNFDGGLTTIEEKSMGAVVKSGSRQIQGVLKVAQRPRKKGLWLMDAGQDGDFSSGFYGGGDAQGILDMVTLGTHFNFLVTGRGHTVGTPIAPTIKITGNPKTYAAMSGDIDINAGKLLTGASSDEEMVQELFDYIAGLCKGKKVLAEQLGHHEGEIFGGYQVPDRVVRPEGCPASTSL